ncbi:antitoxin MazE family protein [Mycobacterium sp. GA-2829]|uniref:antitoxin MazE family protein n=1 Tax=Mycobacterium sp. GA-2829 TaxID=1772283 RepID=UPI0009EB1902|nr:antitoxin MazE family protein [Mycobacterium sp. GA-2829]
MAHARNRLRRRRESLRRQGLRPVQIVVPDVDALEFGREAHRQSALVAAGEHEADDQAFVDAVSVCPRSPYRQAPSSPRHPG